MDVVQAAPNDGCFNCSLETLSTNLQQLKDLCENKHSRSNVETASSLIRKLQRTIAERCADLSRARDALHNAQHQVSSLQSERHSIEGSIQQQQINQLSRIKVAKARLQKICDVDDTAYDGTMTSTIVSTNATISRQKENHNISPTNDTCGDFCLKNGVSSSSFHAPMFQEKHFLTPTVGPVVLGRPIASPIGPVRGRREQLDRPTVRSENTLSNQENSEQHTCKFIPHNENVKIVTIDPDGKYIKLRNTSMNQNYDLGQCRLQQEIAGHPVAVFRFPPETTLLSLDNLTVWAEGRLPTIGVSEPTDLIFRGLKKWGAGPHFTTLLFNHSGQILSQWSAEHRPSTTNPFQSAIQLQQPPGENKRRASSSTPTTILSRCRRNGKSFSLSSQQV